MTQKTKSWLLAKDQNVLIVIHKSHYSIRQTRHYERHTGYKYKN